MRTRTADDRTYYLRNQEQQRHKSQAWIAANPDRWRALHHIQKRRRKARLAALPSTLTAAEWQETLEYFHHRCAYCLVPLTTVVQEHMRPAVRGGGYTQTNIVPSCPPCNQRKGTSPVWEMLR